MTEQQIIETLATKVMGWSKGRTEDFDGYEWRVKGIWLNDKKQMAADGNWNPLQNIADAWKIVEKFKTFRESRYLAYLVFYEGIPSSIYAITPRTICDAAWDALEVLD